jgi:thymidine kinase
VLLGETAEYEPLSRAAYFKAMLKEKVKGLEVNDVIALTDPLKNSEDANSIPTSSPKQSN